MTLTAQKTLVIKSSAFLDGEPIPSKYTCDGPNVNPPLTISDLPEETVSLAIIMDDPDAPAGTFVHWIAWNIPPDNKISENSTTGIYGKNGKGENKYTGPCPPTGVHHYHYRVYALDKKLDISASTDKPGLLKAMEGHILASGELTGTYKKIKII